MSATKTGVSTPPNSAGPVLHVLPGGKGDPRAELEAHHEEHAQRVYAHALSLLRGDVDKALDVVQDTFVSLWKVLAGSEAPHTVGSWLLRTARNRCLNLLREVAPKEPLDLDDHHVDPRPGPAEALVAKESAQLLAGIVDELPEAQRTVFYLRTDAALTFEEIAEVMECSVSTAKRHMRAAAARLEERAQELGVIQ